ncbi:MAG: rhomboid family intramembrane serine protease [Verrucomicrobiota bacterium]|nr:rhomboid family intramembrane serine protease [Verrucomicrobiota bacterium]
MSRVFKATVAPRDNVAADGSVNVLLDLNHILLFIAWISPAILLARTWRGDADQTWRRGAIVVLIVTAVATLLSRDRAGFIAGGAWFCLLYLPAVGIRKATEAAQRGNFIRARRILRVLRFVHSRRNLFEHERVIAAIEAAHAQGRRFSSAGSRALIFGRPRSRMTPVVATMIALNVAMFSAEIALGGATNFNALHRLGALEPYAVLARGEYWRLLTATFLHFGALHLGVNLLALSFFGPTLEAIIGGARFAFSYLICGVFSCAEVAAMWKFGHNRADQLVGASGAVMGIVGAWAGVLLRERHLAHNRAALRSILLIIVIQSAFDFLTPQVSMAAHLGGFTLGVIVGLLVAPRVKSAAVDERIA